MAYIQRFLRDILLALLRPVHLAASDYHLAWPLDHPLVPILRHKVQARVLEHIPHRLHHHVLHLQQPLLHHAPRLIRVDLLLELHHLVLRRDHGRNLSLLVELKLADSLKALLEVWLHSGRVLCLRQDLQQLVVGQEEEPGEEETLLFQIVVQALLDVFQQAVGVDEFVEHTVLVCCLDDFVVGSLVLN